MNLLECNGIVKPSVRRFTGYVLELGTVSAIQLCLAEN